MDFPFIYFTITNHYDEYPIFIDGFVSFFIQHLLTITITIMKALLQ